MKQDQLDEIKKLHRKWVIDEVGGVRANLSGEYLIGANLREANLREADLIGANLKWANLIGANLKLADLIGANLKWADLKWANLRGANLKGADLIGANLKEANLSGANLSGANLRYSIGNGREIRTIQTGVYHVCISEEDMAIGCKQHTIEEWMEFSDDEIYAMDGDVAVEFWKTWKPMLMEIVNTKF